MAELQTHGSHENRNTWRDSYDLSIEGRVGRRRKTGRGIMALLSRMHRVGAFLGVNGRHVNHSNEQHPSTVAVQRELTAPKVNRALTTGEGLPGKHQAVVAERHEQVVGPVVMPEVSHVRPETTDDTVIDAGQGATPYVGRHRHRPENLGEYEASLRDKSPVEVVAAPRPETTVNDGFTFSGEDIVPASHGMEGIAGNELWGLPQRTPGERYSPTEDVSTMERHTREQYDIVAHDNNAQRPVPRQTEAEASDATDAAPEPENWFGGSNSRR